MKINRDQFDAIENGDECIIEGKPATLEENNDWVDDGKHQLHDIIFKHDGKYYSAWENRCGSYFTEYYYSWESDEFVDCTEVKPVTVRKTEWHVV